MRLFVTGGTGFIGRHFLRMSLEHGHDVTALMRTRPTAHSPIVPPLRWIEKQMPEVKPEDVDDVDVLVHLAASGVSPQAADWDELFRVNVVESLHLWRTAIKAGVKRLVICGSCFEYGRSGEHYEFIPVDAPLLPTNAYGASKAAASIAAVALAHEQLVQLTLIRPFHVFGDGDPSTRFWPSLKLAAETGKDFSMTAGEQIRDFTPVQTVAAHLLAACQRNDLLPGQPKIQNVGTGQAQSLRQFAERWWKAWGATGRILFGALPYRSGEVMRYVPKVNP